MPPTEQPRAQVDPTTDPTAFEYTGPGTLAGRFMRRFWQPVYLAADLLPGHTTPVRIMSEDFTLYRGEGGAPHAVAFRCAHRGTQLSTGWVEGDCIRCFYHGWKYDQTGQCVEMPAEDPSFPPKVQIRRYPTEEYLGLVFVYLGEGEPPPLPRYPECEEPGVLEASTSFWACNYFNRLENSPDEVHVHFVHRSSPLTADGLTALPIIACEETDYGFVIRGTRPGGATRISHFHMPNVMQRKGSPRTPGDPWVESLAWRVPVDDESCVSFNVDLVHVTGDAAERYRERRQQRQAEVAPTAELARAVLAGEIRIGDVADVPNVVNVQDYVSQIGQGAIANRGRERLGRSDSGVIFLRRLWQRELAALAVGRPLKAWQATDHLVTTVGV